MGASGGGFWQVCIPPSTTRSISTASRTETSICVADRGSARAGAGRTLVKVHPVTGDPTVVASGGFLRAPFAIVVLEGTPADLPARTAFP